MSRRTWRWSPRSSPSSTTASRSSRSCSKSSPRALKGCSARSRRWAGSQGGCRAPQSRASTKSKQTPAALAEPELLRARVDLLARLGCRTRVARRARRRAVALLVEVGRLFADAIGFPLQALRLGLELIGLLALACCIRRHLRRALLMRGRLLAMLVGLAAAGSDDLTVDAPAAHQQERQRSQRQHYDDDDDCSGQRGPLPSRGG